MSATEQEQKTEVAANGALSYEQVRDTVLGWPVQMRIVLMRELLDTLTEPADRQERKQKALSRMLGLLKTEKPAPSEGEMQPYGPKRDTLSAALGLASTDKPAPSDEDVARWLDERRMEKYG